MLTLHGGCHCGAVRYTVTLDDGQRLQAEYCHCNDCRLTIGFFCGLYATAPSSAFTLTANPADAAVRYNASAAFGRTHCGKCGTSLGCAFDQELVFITASTLELPADTPRGLAAFVDVRSHIFADSPPEGGIGCIMDDGLPRFAQREGAWTAPPADSELAKRIADVADCVKTWGEELKGSCHCKGIEFAIHRPPEDYADDPLLKPRIKEGRRFMAMHCMCDTCRRVSGAPFFTWTFVPTKLLSFSANATERTYQSSPYVNRRFCGTCGCTVGYTIVGRDDMWGLSASILEQPRAEGWIAFEPAPSPEGTEDAARDKWLKERIDATRIEKPLSHPKDAEKYNPELLEAVRRGREKCGRF